MYAEARGVQAQGMMAYVSGKSQAPMVQAICITSITLKILHLAALPIYIAISSRCDYGTFILTFS